MFDFSSCHLVVERRLWCPISKRHAASSPLPPPPQNIYTLNIYIFFSFVKMKAIWVLKSEAPLQTERLFCERRHRIGLYTPGDNYNRSFHHEEIVLILHSYIIVKAFNLVITWNNWSSWLKSKSNWLLCILILEQNLNIL